MLAIKPTDIWNHALTILQSNGVVQVELNSDGKIRLEELVNDSVGNGVGNAGVTKSNNSSIDDTKSTVDTSKQQDSDETDTAKTADISDNDLNSAHLSNNQINSNNNHIESTVDRRDNGNLAVVNANEAEINDLNTTCTDANGGMLNNDIVNDNKHFSNHKNSDAAKSVGFTILFL